MPECIWLDEYRPYFFDVVVVGLEKNPTLVPTQFKPNMDYYNVKLTPEAEELFETVMHRLADRVRIRRIQVRLMISNVHSFT